MRSRRKAKHTRGRLWVESEPQPEVEARLSRELGVSRLLSRLLANRGLLEPEAASRFLRPDLHALHDPSELKDMDVAVDRVCQAVDAEQRITLYSDYDVDGVTGTSILYHFFGLLDQNVATYIPERRKEGYGLNVPAIEAIAEAGCDLLITIDCGIRGLEPAERAAQLGIDVIITDHHEPGEDLPKALAVINHRRSDCPYPFKMLCGAGVAFKLVWAVAQRLSRSKKVTPEFRRYLIEAMGPAAMGTIADIVPLFDENRILATYGLRCLPTSKFPGVRSLLEGSDLAGQQVKAEDVAFRLGPRLNAAGRMGSAQRALELLTTMDAARGEELARELTRENRERQRVERQITERAIEEVLAQGLDRERVLVLWGDGWHPGVIGIVASRLVDRFHLPAVVIAMDGDRGRGSARSVEGYHIFNALLACQQHLIRCGGHAAAAGLEVQLDQLEPFREAMQEQVRRTLDEKLLLPRLRVDAEASFSEIDERLVEDIARLEPTGSGNPPAVFISRDVELVGVPRQVGKDGSHLSFWARQAGRSFKAIAFGWGDQASQMTAGGKLSLAYSPKINNFRGMSSVELYIEDMKIDA